MCASFSLSRSSSVRLLLLRLLRRCLTINRSHRTGAMTSAATEPVLIGQARNGSKDAFARLVVLHQQPLRAFLRRLSGDWAEADDLAQEVFVIAWMNIVRFR